MPGRFITIEGIDGSGKSRVSESIVEALRKQNVDAVLTTEPTHTWLGEAVKRSYNEHISVFTEALLFLADRATHTEQIKKWIEEGKTVVCDRYADSTYAYQAARLKDKVPNAMEWLIELSKPFVIEPDLIILLDVVPMLGLERIDSRSRKVHFENEAFLWEVRANYLKLVETRGYVVIDASKSIEEVKKEALKAISSRAKE